MEQNNVAENYNCVKKYNEFSLLSIENNFDTKKLVQDGVLHKNLCAANLKYLDGSSEDYYIHKNANGETLFNLICLNLNLIEKDYFGLYFYNKKNVQYWLYKKKKIKKQIKVLPWKFYFGVKFYPPHPSQLAKDLTRHLLYLQLRKDVFEEKLPVSFITKCKLGAYIAQAEFGNYSTINDYLDKLQNAKVALVVSDFMIEKIIEYHKKLRGLTSKEAEISYLNECKELSMYGIFLFSAKDSKEKSVQIGVNPHGINVYINQVRIYRFVWSNIVKLSYRRHVFFVKLKAGEIENKDTTIAFNLCNYSLTKQLWKCAVEHHTFFRLIQPDIKTKSFFF